MDFTKNFHSLSSEEMMGAVIKTTSTVEDLENLWYLLNLHD